jgi:hypothetical protein
MRHTSTHREKKGEEESKRSIHSGGLVAEEGLGSSNPRILDDSEHAIPAENRNERGEVRKRAECTEVKATRRTEGRTIQASSAVTTNPATVSKTAETTERA